MTSLKELILGSPHAVDRSGADRAIPKAGFEMMLRMCPNVERLALYGHAYLTTLLAMPSVTDVVMHNGDFTCESLLESFRNLPNLKRAEFKRPARVYEPPGLVFSSASVETLSVLHCASPALKFSELPAMHTLRVEVASVHHLAISGCTALRELTLKSCPRLNVGFLVSWLVAGAPNLEYLKLENVSPFEEEHFIKYCEFSDSFVVMFNAAAYSDDRECVRSLCKSLGPRSEALAFELAEIAGRAKPSRKRIDTRVSKATVMRETYSNAFRSPTVHILSDCPWLGIVLDRANLNGMTLEYVGLSTEDQRRELCFLPQHHKFLAIEVSLTRMLHDYPHTAALS
eukprot:TRINITY_DN7722_c0_g2_i1.p1 TRINITY_DN7722_c0_g2~~TRINITY_DN7722_c0_g2_i1.p1  ORF type:complete len:396 (-),score=71.97 TRINITY_DN7722_c0_g2_i1:256-1281(-)